MADQVSRPLGRLSDELKDDVLDNTRQYAFSQVVRLLMRAVNDVNARGSEIGRQIRAEDEMIRFRSNNALHCPPSDVDSVEVTEVTDQHTGQLRDRYHLTVNFMGLHGVNSPLPSYYNEANLWGDPEDNPRRDFLDFFHHRSISLLYRIWEKYRYYVQFEPGAKDPFSNYAFALVGLLDSSMRGRSNIEWQRVLSYLGLIVTRSRSATIIRGVLSHCFLVENVQIEQRVLRKVTIPKYQRNELGRRNCTLTKNCYLGSRVPDRNGKFRIVMGPLSFSRFRDFLPGQPDYQALRDLVQFMLRDQLAYDIKLLLRADDIPAMTLAKDSVNRLGWSTWLGNAPEADEAVIIHGRN